ncbi:MAG: hypothetical protein O7C98_12545 [Planctomycetota bacterium]|nr:hypothetical protein [Planctomycetota bacterium]
MKAVPVLAVLNVVTLCLVGLLYFQQGEREDQTGSRRAPASRSAGTDTAALEARVALLEEQLLQLGIAERRGPAARGTAGATPGADPADGPARESAQGAPADARPGETGTALQGPRNEAERTAFREQVQRAIDEGRQEEAVGGLILQIDKLIENQKVSRLNADQKTAVAKRLLAARERIPGIWRTVMRGEDTKDLPLPERMALVRSEYETLRAETQKQMAATITMTDAIAITEAIINFGGAPADAG